MAKSVIVVVSIILLTAFAVVFGFRHTIDTVEEFAQRLDAAYLDPKTDALKNIAEEWDKEKKTLMFLINHRDVESVSISMIRAYEEALAGRYEVAVQEISVAKFQLEELVERERISLENIF